MAKLYVGNLSFSVTDDALLQLFTGQGFGVVSAKVITDKFTGQSRGFGFVELAEGEDLARAISQLNGFNFEGRNLTVNEARPQTPRSGGRDFGGGGGRGRGGDRGGRGDRGDRGWERGGGRGRS
jgi:RNA recognition motif-containing protein